MRIALIAALARNRVIGRDGTLPWHLPEDLRRFKRLTTGHTVVMGRKTYASIGKPLPHRRNIVITASPIPGVETYPSPEEALAAAAGDERVFIIGGGQLFNEMLDTADELYLTLIEKEIPGDTFFPPYEHLIGTDFREKGREEHEGYTFVDYERVRDGHIG